MAFLTEKDRQKIANAIIAAERTTSGELVAVVAQAADDTAISRSSGLLSRRFFCLRSS